ncbi:GyrI-like domain-containing protein [Anaerotignum sp. MB30-C6]|uniref:GyrI-like domain-containing protein n=1 Tax=Anaerotignum sp. MB30-C6 TaxID=3070814 RepID=UPI0027DB902C|nr:GyrI-like domain-containing protein [Anaerotignum sp. MB30-C6]WMI81437.1 GyrI-like domain-containing protein [Anaerotignum sp. MB30-C6]
MSHSIQERDAFTLIGRSVQLTNSKKENVRICSQFWRSFNSDLKKSCLSMCENWVKYALMERKNGKLFYFCAIPTPMAIPEQFVSKEIPFCKYCVVEHIGPMNRIYDTYTEIYKQILPDNGYVPFHDEVLHFEKYDDRFHWNRRDSIITIWVPIK